MFKNLYITVFVILGLVVGSCTKESDKHLFNTSMQVNFTIPAGLDNINTHYFIIHDIPSFYKERRDISGVKDEDVIKILASKALIKPRYQEVNYGMIRDVSLKVFVKDQSKLEAFYLENISFNENNELKLLSSLTNLKEILSNPLFDLEIRINFKTFTPLSSENIIELNFSAFAEL